MNDINYLQRLANVFFLVKVLNRKVTFVMILNITVFEYLVMSFFFLKSLYFYVSSLSTAAPNSSITTLYNFLDPSNSYLSTNIYDMPVMQLPYHGPEGPLTDVPSDTPSPTLPYLKRSTRVNFGKPPN